MAARSLPRLLGSEEYVVFVCETLDEVNKNNPNNWIKCNSQKNPTTNISLQLTTGPEDLALWEVLDEATYCTIQAMTSQNTDVTPDIEYWIDNPAGLECLLCVTRRSDLSGALYGLWVHST